MAWYKTGNVSVITGSSVVTAKDTRFASNVRVGDGFRGPDGEWYEIVNIASETVLGIYPTYQGATENDSTNYMVAPLQGYNKESADRLRAITDSLRDITGEVEEAKQSAAQAKASELAAKASETSAGQSKDAAKISEDAAKASELAAKNSETSASTSEQSATASAESATQSASDANASKVAAKASQDASKVSETNSKSSEQASKASEIASKTSETNSKTSETNAAGSASSAATDAITASDAADDADVARVAAEKARDEAVAASGVVTGSLTDLGPVDLSSGQYPAKPVSSSFWKVVVGGDVTVGGETIDYGVGDTLIYSKIIDEFYKIDNTESVSSVNGKTGVVVVDKADVGLSNVNNTSDVDKPLSTEAISALQGKEPAILTGTAQQFLNGLKGWSDFDPAVRSALLTGLAAGTDNPILATDTLIQALGKLQTQTIGKLKKGDFGIGGPAIPVPEGDCNKALVAGNYRTIPATLNGRGVYAILEVFDYGDNGTSKIQRLTATYGNTVGDAMWFRTGTDQGAKWSDWRRIVSVGNYGVGADPRTGSPAELVGAIHDANVLLPSGTYLVHAETLNSPKVYGTFRMEWYDASGWTQTITQINTGEVWTRGCINGSIGNWAKLGGAVIKKWVSGWTTVAASTNIYITHNLGAKPFSITLEARLKVAVAGYTAGTIINITSNGESGAAVGMTFYNLGINNFAIQASNANAAVIHATPGGALTFLPWSSCEIQYTVVAV